MAQQALRLRSLWPTGEIALGPTSMTWTGPLQPTVMSAAYRVNVAFSVREPLQVSVVEPPLDTGHRTELPHVYEGDYLCLYSNGDWDRTMYIAETIIPWAAEWLFHYELWLATNRWNGGGKTHEETPSAPNERTSPKRLPAR